MPSLDSISRKNRDAGRVVLMTAAFALLFSQRSAAQGALFTPAETELIRLTQENPVAKAEFTALKEEADAALRDRPNPIRKIQTEGKLAGDPDKVATQSSLKDMRKLWALGYAYEISGEGKYAGKARTFILAWSGTNRPTGDPIDETNLESLIVAYDQTRETFSPEDRTTADGYLRRVIQAEWDARQGITNWQSHRLKIVGLAAYVLRDDALVARAVKGFRDQIAANLNPDGSSYDFHERDALHYHVYDLEPLLALAIAAHSHGLDLYDYTSPEGASLRRSVHFLIPFCTGEEEHHEFVHSKIEFDRKRAANGEKGYQIGHLFRPEEGFKALALAAYFDDAVDGAVARLSSGNTNPMVAWSLVLDQAGRPNGPKPAQGP
jgi:hypothetical protein